MFWASCIVDAVIQTLAFFFLKETYGPQILHRKAKKLRKETGDQTYRSEYELSNESLTNKLAVAMVRPFRLIVTQPIIQALTLFQAYIYGKQDDYDQCIALTNVRLDISRLRNLSDIMDREIPSKHRNQRASLHCHQYWIRTWHPNHRSAERSCVPPTQAAQSGCWKT